MNVAETTSTPTQRWVEAQQLFDQALAQPAPDRRRYVGEIARQDPWLHDAVLELLALDEASSPLDCPLPDLSKLQPTGVSLQAGDRIGKYRIGERIGAGGMGCVYRAEHVVDSMRQEVALKVLRADLSAETRQRFAQEQRILANLQHPHIARLHDFGSTPSGITYLVMNLIEGTSITEFADAEKLPIGQRIRLFVQVCDTVRYAHQRLVVHRDLKPANILVDGDGNVQLLDFGIAKVLDPQSHLQGAATRTELRVMTPSYASPEQLFGRQVTTGTDIWALGVLLFELLTGQRPFNGSDKSLLELERHLQLAPRPKASATFSSDFEGAAQRARLRGQEPLRLRRQLRGDLDLIVARALAYRPEERYPSAEALAQDLERFQNQEPILARPPSWTYRASKLIRRHTVAALCLALTLTSLIAFAVLQTLQSQRLKDERDFARQQRDKAELMSDLLEDVLGLANPSNPKLNRAAQTLLEQSTQRLLKDFERQPEARATMLTRIGILYRRLGDYEQAEALLTRAAETWQQHQPHDLLARAQTLDALGFVYHHQRDPRAAETLRYALKLFWQGHRGDHPEVAQTLTHLAATQRYAGEPNRSEALLSLAIAMDQRLGNELTAEAGARLADLATLLGQRGERQRGLALFDQALEIQGAAWGRDSVVFGLTLNRKAGLFQERPFAEEAIQLLHTATEIFRHRLGEDHPLVATGLNNLAQTYQLINDYQQAETLQRQAWERDLQRLGEEHPSTLDDRLGLAMILRETGRLEEAEEHLRETVTILARVTASDHPALISQRIAFGRVLSERGLEDQAAQQLDLALTAARSKMGREHWLTGSTQISLAELALQSGRLEEAETLASSAVHIFRDERIGPERWRLGEARSVLGATLIRLNRHEEAVCHLQSAVATLEELRGQTVATRLARSRLDRAAAMPTGRPGQPFEHTACSS